METSTDDRDSDPPVPLDFDLMAGTLALIIGVLATVAVPTFVSPLASVPPNRDIPLEGGLKALCLTAYYVKDYSWLLLTMVAATVVQVHRGRLRRRLTGIRWTLAGATLLALALLGGVAFLPRWVEDEYGPIVRQRIFEGAFRLPLPFIR